MADALITGGLGFIGRGLAEGLLARGARVRVLDNLRRGDESKLRRGAADVDVIIGDIRDPDVAERAVAGCDTVYHLAAINGTRNFYERPREVLEVGILGTHNVLDAAIRNGVTRFLFMSSSEVYQTPSRLPTDETEPLRLPDPLNPRYSYGGSKIAGEIMAINYGREAFERLVVVRPHNVYGPNMGFDHVVPELALKILRARAAAPGGEPVAVELQGDGRATRAFVYIDDFVDGAVLAMEAGEHLGLYHVGSEEELSILALAERIAAALGVSARFTTGDAPAGQTQRRCPETARIRALGFAPRVGLSEGLPRALESVRAHFRQQAEA